MKKYTRRGALALIATGSALVAADSGALSNTDSERVTDVDVAGDSSAFLSVSGLDEGKVYKEPDDVDLTNSLGRDLTGNNLVSTGSGDLELREGPSDPPSQTLDPGDLLNGDTYSFQVVLSSGKSGEVTDGVTVYLETPGGTSVTLTRTVTVDQKSSGRLVYGRGSDLRVYNVIQDTENDPPDSDSVGAIGANAADIDGDGDADIPYADSNGMYTTSVGASSDTLVFEESDPEGSVVTGRLYDAAY